MLKKTFLPIISTILVVCFMVFSTAVAAEHTENDLIQLRIELDGMLSEAERISNKTGWDESQREYYDTLSLTYIKALEVAENADSTYDELEKALTATTLAIEGKLAKEDIDNYFSPEETTASSTAASTSPPTIALTTVPTDEPTTIQTDASTEASTSASTESQTTETVDPAWIEKSIELNAKMEEARMTFDIDGWDISEEEYYNIGSYVYAKAYAVYADRSSTIEAMDNAITALTLAIEGTLARADIDRYFGSATDSTEVRYKRGDADGDDNITITDVTLIQRRLAAFSVENPAFVEKYGDVDGTGLDITDATYIQRYLAHLSTVEGIGEYM